MKKFTEHYKIKGILQNRTIDNYFVIIFILFALSLNIFTPIIFSYFGFHFFNDLYKLIVFFGWNILIAYRGTLTLFSFLPVHSLPQLDQLNSTPKVALLYVTKDDASSAILKHLENQNYSNYDIFVLDDSEEIEFQNMISQFHYRIIRRNEKQGWKAGNLNNWLHKFGRNYQYCVVLDSDSRIPYNYIVEMLKYAEHSINHDIAIFQSRLYAYESINILSKYQQLLLQVHQNFFKRIGNRTSTLQNWGHNILVRTAAITENGGFNETFVGEDVATTFDLWEKDWKCRFVDVPSWEDVPFSLNAFTTKNVRITLSNLQILLQGRWHVSMFHKVYLLMSIYPIILCLCSLPLLFPVIWFFPISIRSIDMQILLTILSIYWIPLLFGWIYGGFLIFYDFLLFRQGQLKVKEIFLVKFVGLAAMLHLFWPLLKGIKDALIHNKFIFVVTQKNHMFQKSSLKLVIPTFMLGTILFMGVIFRPFAFVFNAHWLVYLSISFYMLLIIEKEFLPNKLLNQQENNLKLEGF